MTAAIAMNSSPAKRHPKLFVLDTNVILHDAGCIRNFEENDIAIPITVLEELDHFKKGHDDINFQAREFLRTLRRASPATCSRRRGLRSARAWARSASCSAANWSQRLEAAFSSDAPDHRILNTALHLQQQESHRQVVLVSKDTNLRMKAKALGVPAQDYTSDKVESVDKLYTGRRIVEGMPSEVDRRLLQPKADDVPATSCRRSVEPLANENFILRNGSKSVLATYRPATQTFVRVEQGRGLRHQAAQRRAVVRPERAA